MRGLRANRLRSVLTTLGIIIGVAAVIVLVALGDGVQHGFNEQFGRLANQITLSKANGTVSGGGTARDLTDDDVTALRSHAHAPDIQSVTPSTQGSTVLTVGQDRARASVIGTTADYVEVTDREMAAGSFFTAAQEKAGAKVVVLGIEATSYLFGVGVDPNVAIGQDIRVDRSQFKVIGVLKDDSQQDNVAIMPLEASRSTLAGGGKAVDQVIVKSTSASTVDAAVTQINTILDDRHRIKDPKERDYNVRANRNLLNQRNQFIGFLTLFTAAVAAISLIVGGIGVANIMLVAVTERTREIGIRKAIGAPRSAILKQFLIEAVVLSGLGGLVGVGLGLAIAELGGKILTARVPEFPAPIVTFPPVLLSFGVSLLIGVVAGGYPAKRAAWLRPIEALRSE
jgi:putative ABC transport system permease protein